MTLTAAAPTTHESTQVPTIWGCTPGHAHDRFWAAFGVQVVRRHERSGIVEGAELFLLCESDTLVLLSLAQVLDTLYWLDPRLLELRLRDSRPREYRETAVTADDRLVRFQRDYRDARARSIRVALTRDRDVAKLWQNAPHVTSPWRWLRSIVSRDQRLVRTAAARVYDARDDAQVMECLRAVLQHWRQPDATIGRARRCRAGVWADETATIDADASFTGPVWIGAGRRIDAGMHIVGPAVLWDDPNARPSPGEVRWLEIEPTSLATDVDRRVLVRTVPGKRLFDILLALCALVVTLPLYPLVALAILVEDGRPILYRHRRETVGGRVFGCIKFRSMRNCADIDKAKLAKDNEADGPQFYMKDDPRVTRVGRIIRKLQIDELPQLLNVLVGHMSIVGPRPSPQDENQYCPAWREARLSVRPGLTGLWQVSRTRRQGLDFQEWIKFDLEYVENADWGLDLWIILRTVGVVLRGLA